MKIYNVAIIIPTLNEEHYIEDCLKSLMIQTYPFEQMDVMVVDGGSTDATKALVETFSKQHPNVRLIENPGRIQSIAFNIGVRSSSAPYVIRMDAHALYGARYVELCVKHLQTNSLLGNVGGVWLIKAKNAKLISEANAILNQVRFGIGGASFRVGGAAQYVDTVPFGAFPRPVLEKIGGMREDLPRGEDNEFNYRIRKANYKIYLDPEIQCTYFSRDSIGGSMKQMYANGFSIGCLLHIEPHCVSLRHLIPFGFVMGLLIPLIAGILTVYSLYLSLIIFALYMTANIVASCLAAYKFGLKHLFILPLLFLLVHLSYGWGTTIGLLKKHY